MILWEMAITTDLNCCIIRENELNKRCFMMMIGMTAVIMIFLIPIIAIVTEHSKQKAKIKLDTVKRRGQTGRNKKSKLFT